MKPIQLGRMRVHKVHEMDSPVPLLSQLPGTTADDLKRRDELVQWGCTAVARIEGFYNDNPDMPVRDVHFTFLKPDNGEVVVSPSNIIGE